MNLTFIIDVLVAAVIAVIVLAVLSGVALAGAVALVVLALCGITLLFDRRRARSTPRPRRSLR